MIRIYWKWKIIFLMKRSHFWWMCLLAHTNSVFNTYPYGNKVAFYNQFIRSIPNHAIECIAVICMMAGFGMPTTNPSERRLVSSYYVNVWQWKDKWGERGNWLIEALVPWLRVVDSEWQSDERQFWIDRYDDCSFALIRIETYVEWDFSPQLNS